MLADDGLERVPKVRRWIAIAALCSDAVPEHLARGLAQGVCRFDCAALLDASQGL